MFRLSTKVGMETINVRLFVSVCIVSLILFCNLINQVLYLKYK